jgi:glyoxylase-like metal-dependent hydrolase (beta-lactamase superfamily II)
MDGPPVGPFAASRPISKDGRFFLVPTPGQMIGHVSAVLRLFFAGDATYSEENLLAEQTDGVTNDPRTALATLRAIKQFAAAEPTSTGSAQGTKGVR